MAALVVLPAAFALAATAFSTEGCTRERWISVRSTAAPFGPG